MERLRRLVQPVKNALHRDRSKKRSKNVASDGEEGAQHINDQVAPVPCITVTSPVLPPRSRSSRLNSRASTPTSDGGRVSPDVYSGPSSISEIEIDDWLGEELSSNRIETTFGSQAFFVPKQTQKSLITASVVKECILRRFNTIEASEAQEWADKTCRSARQLFATLAIMGKAGDIYSFLKDGVSDKDIPLERDPPDRRPFSLRRKGTKRPIWAMEKWTDNELEEFDRRQWWMTSPVFKYMKHHELADNEILPFIPFKTGEEIPEIKQGGFSEVFPARVHPEHHNFWNHPGLEDQVPLIAVKKLYSPEPVDFEKERLILGSLGVKEHKSPHLVELLATYRQKGKFHFLFHYADANLKKYWQDQPLPNFDKTILWAMKQMIGIAGALSQIHNFSPSDSLLDVGTAESQKQNGQHRVPRGEGRYGRHGDIKPENILWFQSLPGADYGENGILRVADFGLGRLHGRNSRSNVNPETIFASPTYKSPEYKLGKFVSRAYDIWSLGALYLEFITWVLMGWEAVGCFADFRGGITDLPETDCPDTPRPPGTPEFIELNDDHFFTVTESSTAPRAEVRHGVLVWVNKLHQHEKCSALIHELLDLIMKQLLVIDPKARIPANKLCLELDTLLKKSEQDPLYLLQPSPWPPGSNSELLGQLEQPVVSAPEPRPFAVNEVVDGSSRPIQQQPPRDLVRRAAGTPGFNARHSMSWPISTDH